MPSTAPRRATHPTSGAGHTIRTRSVTRRVRVSPGRAWWAGLVALPLVLALASLGLFRGGVEDTLRDRLQQHLQGAGLGSVSVDVDGRDVVAHVPAGTDRQAVEKTIKNTDGVRDVEVRR